MVVENCGLQPRQLLLDLPEGEGFVVGMAIYAYIHTNTATSGQGAMAMAMQHPGAVVMLIPHVEGVMTHHKLGSVGDLGLMKGKRPAPIEKLLEPLVFDNRLVVITRKEADFSV